MLRRLRHAPADAIIFLSSIFSSAAPSAAIRLHDIAMPLIIRRCHALLLSDVYATLR